MNRSGIAVREVLHRYQETPENVVVIYDDLDLNVGRLRIRQQGGHGGHKGIKSIIEDLNTHEFVRIKIGIGRPDSATIPEGESVQEHIVEYVLQPFQQDEQPIITEVLKRCVEAIKLIIADQLDAAMNRYNRC
jgi:PTH1 family peptidyl-tRNA hydrolase